MLGRRGFLARIFGPLFRLVGKSWQMYPLGFLFGLGFDTATEVALLGIAAAEAAKGLSLGAVLIFPALFTAGMALVDTTDSVLMVGAYGWAFVEPLRKLTYNLTITLVSVVVAVGVGGIEALGLVADRLGLTGPFWDADRPAQRQFRRARLRPHRHIPGGVARLGAVLAAARDERRRLTPRRGAAYGRAMVSRRALQIVGLISVPVLV